MMTYLPLYLQNGFGLSPVAAGLGMLPFALPLFVCPRIAAALSSRISGRDLLTLGLMIVAIGNVTEHDALRELVSRRFAIDGNEERIKDPATPLPL